MLIFQAPRLFDTGGANAGILDGDLTGITSNAYAPGGSSIGFTGGDGTGTVVSVFTLDISAVTDSTTDLADLDSLIGAVDEQLGALTDAATNLGSIKTRVDMQNDFISELTDAIDRGIGQLVDADMNEESTPPESTSGSAAAWHSGSLDCQLWFSEHSVSVPVS